MIKVLVRNLDNVLKFEGDFSTQIEADAWIRESIEIERFGKAAYEEIIPAVLDEEGNELEPEQVINHPATYTVEIVDITAELEQKQKLTTRAEKRAFGESVIDLISTINESANVNEATLEALILDQDFLVIREHLYSGSLKSAYNKILASETKILTVFSQSNLDLVKSQLLAKLQQLGEL